MKRHFRLQIAVALIGVALASGCHRQQSALTPDSTVERPAALAKGGAASGNGEGYLGMVSRNYQILPGYECSDGTTRKLGYAASLYKDREGRILLTGDACSENLMMVVQPQEVTPVAGGNLVSVRGGLFQYSAETPTPAVEDEYRQLYCGFKSGNAKYSVHILSNMAGTKQLLRIFKTWLESDAASPGWIENRSEVTSERIGTHQIYRGVTRDVVIDLDYAQKGYKGQVLTRFHYSGSEQFDTEDYCFGNESGLKQ